MASLSFNTGVHRYFCEHPSKAPKKSTLRSDSFQGWADDAWKSAYGVGGYLHSLQEYRDSKERLVPPGFFFPSKHLNLRLADGGSYHVAHLQTHLQRRVPWIKKLFTPRRVTKSRHCSWFSEKGFERPLDFAFSMFVEKLLEPQLNET